MMQNYKPLITYFELAIAQCCVGTSIVITKHLVHALPIMLLLYCRFTIGGLCSLAYLALIKQSPFKDIGGNSFSRRDWVILLMQCLCGGFLFSAFMLPGLNLTSTTTAGMITCTLPAFIVILSFFVLKEIPTRNKLAAVFITILGLIILTLSKGNAVKNHNSLWGGTYWCYWQSSLKPYFASSQNGNRQKPTLLV